MQILKCATVWKDLSLWDGGVALVILVICNHATPLPCGGGGGVVTVEMWALTKELPIN